MSVPAAPGGEPGTTPGPVALDLRDHVLFDAAGPAYQPVAEASALRLGLICLEPKQGLPARIADSDRLYTVIGGRAWVVVDDAEVTLDPLQAVLVPHGAAYGVRNDSADPLILQVVTAAAGDLAAPSAESGVSVERAEGGASVEPTPDSPASAGRAPGDEPDAPPPQADKPDVWTRLRRLLGSE